MPSGDSATGSARLAQATKGRKGGPPKGNSGRASRAAAKAPITRSLQRLSGSGAPSANSGAAAKADHRAGPTLPSKTRVPAARPPDRPGTASAAVGWKAPRGVRPSAAAARSMVAISMGQGD